jgi:Ca2+-binding EF-hand superfamily protein
LIQKLSQRVKSNNTEMNILSNAFKFYDLANSGICNRSQWIKTIGKIGLSGFSERDLSLLFDIYDSQAKGSLDYRVFISDLFKYKPRNQVGPKISLPIRENYDEPK